MWMARSSKADFKGNNKRAWSRCHLWHAAVHSNQQGSHACTRLCEEGIVTEDKESTVGSGGETENCDRSLRFLFVINQQFLINTITLHLRKFDTILFVNHTLLIIYHATRYNYYFKSYLIQKRYFIRGKMWYLIAN